VLLKPATETAGDNGKGKGGVFAVRIGRTKLPFFLFFLVGITESRKPVEKKKGKKNQLHSFLAILTSVCTKRKGRG